MHLTWSSCNVNESKRRWNRTDGEVPYPARVDLSFKSPDNGDSPVVLSPSDVISWQNLWFDKSVVNLISSNGGTLQKKSAFLKKK